MTGRITLIVVLFLCLCVALFFTWQYKTGAFDKAPEHPPEVQQMIDQTYGIEYLDVISGNEFDLKLDNGMRIHAFLVAKKMDEDGDMVLEEVKTPPRAKKDVIRLVNGASAPVVEIRDKVDDRWLVEIVYSNEAGRLIVLADEIQSMRLNWE